MYPLAIVSGEQKLGRHKELTNLIVILIVAYLLTDTILDTDG